MLRKLRKMLRQQEGFTLVELMIVVVILGIISGIGIQQYGQVQQRARDAANNANKKVIASAAQMYVLMDGSDPEHLTVEELVDEGYLDAMPVHPEDKTYSLTVTLGEDGAPPKISVTDDGTDTSE